MLIKVLVKVKCGKIVINTIIYVEEREHVGENECLVGREK